MLNGNDVQEERLCLSKLNQQSHFQHVISFSNFLVRAWWLSNVHAIYHMIDCMLLCSY